MKKALGIIKSNILIFIGALLFLSFLNYVAMGGAFLALGIIAILTALFFIVIGVLNLIIGDSLSRIAKKIFEIIAVCSFALVLFVGTVISLVNMIQIVADPNSYTTFLPNGWFIMIVALLTSFALLGFYPVARLVKGAGIKKIGLIFACLFVMGAFLNVMFDVQGNAITLGDIPFVYVTILVAFAFYLFGTLGEGEIEEEPKAIPQKAPAKKEKKEAKPEEPAQVEAPKEEKVEEPAPEEAPAEEPKAEE